MYLYWYLILFIIEVGVRATICESVSTGVNCVCSYYMVTLHYVRGVMSDPNWLLSRCRVPGLEHPYLFRSLCGRSVTGRVMTLNRFVRQKFHKPERIGLLTKMFYKGGPSVTSAPSQGPTFPSSVSLLKLRSDGHLYNRLRRQPTRGDRFSVCKQNDFVCEGKLLQTTTLIVD